MNSLPPISIAIAGAGFSGTMLAVQLARRAMRPLHITLYDSQGAFACGVAYGTREPYHLLNVRADKMGAFPDALNDFHQWLMRTEPAWRKLTPAWERLEVSADAFMPRMLYGHYLQALLETAQTDFPLATIETVTAEVTDARRKDAGIELTRSDGLSVQTDRLVLALGSLDAAGLGSSEALAQSPRYTGNIWRPKPGSLLTRNLSTPEDSPVFIVGTGLTAVDMIASLHARGYDGAIVAASRHGLLPRPHAAPEAPYPVFLPPEDAPRTASGIVRAVTLHARRAGARWRSVVDALRGDTNALWAGLPEDERRKLLRILTFWNVHRHRMAPSSEALLRQKVETGQLKILAGRIEAIESVEERLEVRMRSTDGKKESFSAAHVLNCTGPQMRIDRLPSPLLQRLLARGSIGKGPLGMGMRTDGHGRADNETPARIFALGPLLLGERLETVAVPELRQQAELLAQTILASL